jgi:hypothetical protein
MANPFPGIDPYVEDQNYWEDFHTRFLTYACDAINDRLPDGYNAELDERITIISSCVDGDPRGDITLASDERVPMERAAAKLNAVTEPVVIPLPTTSTSSVGSMSVGGMTVRPSP